MTDVDSGGGRKTRPRGRPRNNDDVVIDKTKSDVIDKTVTVEQNERESDDLVDSGKNEHDCVCEEKTWKGEQVLCCDKCNRWWHCSCAGLKGLDDAGARLLVPWLGPCCFVLNKSIQDKLGKVGIAEIVKDEVVKLIPDIVKRVVVEKDKVEGKKWTDFFNNKQNETKKVIKQTMSDNHQKVVKEALLESRKKVDSDNMEREKRKKNIVIQSVPESTAKTNDEKTEDDFGFVEWLLDIPRSDLESVRRIGPLIGSIPDDKRTCRPILAMLSTPELANQQHRHGLGRKVYVEEDKKDYWVNPDLIWADRKANYDARKLKNAKKAKISGNAESQIPPLVRRVHKPTEWKKLDDVPAPAEDPSEETVDDVPAPAEDPSEESDEVPASADDPSEEVVPEPVTLSEDLGMDNLPKNNNNTNFV